MTDLHVDRQPINRAGVRHGARTMAHFWLSTAYRRAAHLAQQTGVRQRVEVCRVPSEDHYLPAAWGDLHFVVKPVDLPETGAGS